MGARIRPEDAVSLYAYIGRIVKDMESTPIAIGGMPDHVHLLCSLSKNLSVAKFMEDVKRHSSRWIKSKSEDYHAFEWQGGYGAFSVSPALLERTKRYIINQEEHHKKHTFHEEYVLFLKEYGVDFNPDFVFHD